MKYLLILFVILSCTKKVNNPEDILTKFVHLRFEKVLNKLIIKDYFAGRILEKFSEFTDDDFRTFKNSNLKYQNIKILHKNCQENECFLTYIVKYQKLENGKVVLNAETKKIAQINKIDKMWKIVDVNNIKTFYQSKKELSINSGTPK